MLEGSDSDSSGAEDERRYDQCQATSWNSRLVLKPPTLQPLGDQAITEFTEVVEQLAAQGQVLDRLIQEEPEMATTPTCPVALAKLQATTCMDLRKEIGSIDRYNGEVGDLNHFLRSGDRVSNRIADRERNGRLDGSDAQSLQSALVRRVHRSILNRLQADDETAWAELKKRLQKEYGGGRWTPEEDALRMLRSTRGRYQSKGDFAAQLLQQYQGVIEKYRETLTGPEAAAKINFVESLAVVQLGEAVGKPLNGSLVELANGLIDAAGRGEEEEAQPSRPREWRAEPRRRERRDDLGPRREPRVISDRRPPHRPMAARAGTRGREERRGRDVRRCYSCGQQGHVQAKCAQVRCYECRSTGHMARSCPYIRHRSRDQVEPMEINHHQAVKRHRSTRDNGNHRTREDTSESSANEECSSKVESSEEEGSLRSYVTVLKRGRLPRESGGGRKVTQE